MIIPIRCMNCGKLIGDKWRFYQAQLKALKGVDAEQRVYFDGNSIPDTAEKKVLDMMKVNRSCCRKHFLTQVDLIDKI
jgi:DNA-directed RNA polymerase subunit N (RpoN/RPB10)